MSAREELAAVLAEHRLSTWVTHDGSPPHRRCSCGANVPIVEVDPHLADALITSPALARVIREAKAEAWDEGLLEGVTRALHPTWPRCANPYRDQTEEPT